MLFRALSLFSLAAALANAEPAEWRGRVLDATSSPIPGAVVTAGTASTTTNASGEFTLPLAPGNYTMKIARENFTALTVEIASPAGAIRDFILQLAPTQQTVSVSESPDYLTTTTSSATKIPTPLRDVPQSVTVISRELMRDQQMMSIADVVRYVPGITATQGENNRDQLVIRGNSTSADFFVNGVRDDVQYYRDIYNVESVEALKGPNALIFGRGGAGGVVNRVTKQAVGAPIHEITIQGGSFDHKRFASDLNHPLNDRLSFRVNGMYENSGSFRDHVNLEHYGIAPTATVAIDRKTQAVLSYEHFHDYRVADRGITSWQGRPAAVPISTYYGNPGAANVHALVNLGSVAIERQEGHLNLRDRFSVGGYDRGYQNFVPGAPTADRSQVPLSTYNNATQRLNVFNQTDVTYALATGAIRHTLLAGAEFGRQFTDNFRNTGYFNNTATSILAPFSNPTIHTPVTFRQSATDADNHLQTNLAAIYTQDQVQLTRHLQAIAGVRIDRFDLHYHNNRNSDNLRRVDNLLSPRAGLVFKPAQPLSIYSSYSVSYLPSSGDQFSSLTTITQQVKPEKFSNYELGVKWDVTRNLALNSAVYRLDRTNTRSVDPNDPTRIVQTGSQRSNGFEIGMSGNLTRAWQVTGGYAYQDAFVTSATASARAGAQVTQAPHNSFSIWNNYRVLRRLGTGIGVINRSDMFAAIDNTVVLPGYTRVDAAVYYSLTERVRLQVNSENLLNRRYYLNADNNTNISPGSPRAVRIGLVARF